MLAFLLHFFGQEVNRINGRGKVMIIKRIYNNSAAAVVDEKGKEMIAVGKGIAYQKSSGDELDVSKVEKLFTLKDKHAASKLEGLISEISPVYISIVDEIVEMIHSVSEIILSDNIYVTLIDHISLSLEREKKGLVFENPILLEIKQYYKQEYKLACESKKIIYKYLGIMISDDEAGFIALHIVNASMNQRFEDTMKATEMIQEILNLVKTFYQVELDEESLYYNRFVRHLQFFTKRVLSDNEEQVKDDFLYRMGQIKYPEAKLCVNEISRLLIDKFKVSITDAERGFLIYHIQSIISNK